MTSKKAAIFSIAILFLLLASSLAFLLMQKQGASGDTAYIYQNGNLLQTIDLSQVNETYSFTIEGENGSYNIVEVRPGSIGITEASCPDHICIDTGFISNGTIPVVCLPNAIIIEVKNGGTKANNAENSSSLPQYDSVAK